MTSRILKKILQTLGLAVTGIMTSGAFAQAVVPAEDAVNYMQKYSAVPPLSTLTESDRMVMLTLSLDHQLFFKAFNDFTDLTGDQIAETDYTSSFSYVGYFNPMKCYSYVSGSGRFEPTGVADANHYCADGAADGGWSGNFLNWLTMTRIDLVRQVLYGGYRSTDAADLTVLERSYLPHDAHSFAKYYSGTDIARLTSLTGDATACPASDSNCRLAYGYTFCNTTQPGQIGALSQAVTLPPLLRVVKGNYSMWASSERYQCLTRGEIPRADGQVDDRGQNGNVPAKTGIYAHSDSPAANLVTDYIVRVKACDTATGVDGEHCKTYGSSTKPVGLLQQYGETGEIKFGLMTGSYNGNKSFGALRKNVSVFGDEVDLSNGTFIPFAAMGATDSIVHNLNALRIVDYRYYTGGTGAEDRWKFSGTYIQNGGANCEWGWNMFSDGQCRNWGNPFSELLAESYRYFAGASAPMTPITSDEGLLPGLTIADWSLPNDEAEDEDSGYACANMNVLGFNASSVSYDRDGLATRTTVQLGLGPTTGTAPTVAALTDEVGAAENINGQHFIGWFGNTGNGQCSPKNITGNQLSLVSGTCPETPRLQGSYLGAGLAKYVYENGVGPNEQKITTYGVTLSGALPKFTVPMPGGEVITVIPACRNMNNDTNCALVQFDPVDVDGPAGTVVRKYFVAWEDSEQGGDYDVDISGFISYAIVGGSIAVDSQIIYETANSGMEFGYVISGTGTSRDGVYFPSRITSDDEAAQNRPSVVDDNTASDWCTSNAVLCVSRNTNEGKPQIQRVSFNVGGDASQPGKFLETPLYYAAKWGSGNNPDAYTEVTNPNRLRQQLDKVISNIIDKPAAGTGASVATTALTGEGIILSTLFEPEISDEDSSVAWVGRLTGLFRSDGLTWEDSEDDNGTAGYRTDADYVVDFYVKQVDVVRNGVTIQEKRSFFTRSTATRDATTGEITGLTPVATDIPYEELLPVWNANEQLSSLTELAGQREYDDTAAGGRYLFTAVPAADTNVIIGGDVIDFTADYFTPAEDTDPAVAENIQRLLDVESADTAANLVNFTRGVEGIEGFRSRTLTVDGENKPWLLGDIMHSTAALVGRPGELYDSDRLGDASYSAFREHYRGRRLMTYVGANDGMLHAFNAGFTSTKSVTTGEGEDAETRIYSGYTPTKEGYTAHPLGAELWAYVPYNLLPHLKWLADPNYQHVYYVDSKVHQFDVNIFPVDEDHPQGWGTIIVVGMRFGGGDYALDANGAAAGGERTLRSAYIVMDVTNPEKPPRLLAEITHPELGYTIGDIDVVSFRDPNAATGSYSITATTQLPRNDWYLVFGSGPKGATALQDASSDQNAKVVYVKLNELAETAPDTTDVVGVVDTGIANAYVGGVRAMDWNSDFDDDMLYFGVVGTGTAADAPKGRLMQAVLNPTAVIATPNSLLSGVGTDLPFSRAPLTIREDSTGSYWVFAATGKFLVKDHLTDIDENRAFGVRVNSGATTGARWLTTTGVAMSSLKDITAVTVSTRLSGGIRLFSVTDPADNDIKTPADMEEVIREDYSGWTKKLKSGELVFTSLAFSGSTLAMNSYIPAVADCSPTGESYQYILNMFTGLPQTENTTFHLKVGTGVVATPANSQGTGDLSDHTGAQPGPLLDVATTGDGFVIPRSDGSFGNESATPLPGTATRRSWREIPLDEVQ